MSGVDCQAPSLRLIHYLKGRGSVKKRTPLYLAILGAFVLIFVEIARYSYINRGLMRQENVSHLQSSYAQVARTFALFAERNWKLLDEWDSDLPNQFYDLTSEEAWSVIRDKAARWQYSELYMFNQNGEYSSVSGRHGISPHKESVFMAIYDENRPVLTSYPSTDGARKVVFAKPIRTPVLMEGSTYTGLAVTFRNDVLEKTISVSLYDGASDCYMVRRDGTVVLSLESQTEFDGLADNMLDFVDGALAVSRSEKAEMRADIAEGKSGSLVGRLDGEEYYIVYQPSGMEDWSIVGVVRASVVEAGARKMQADTISLATLIASLAMLGVSWLILANMKAEAKSLKMEQQMLSRQKEVSDRLFAGMGRIADRYAVCDLVRDRYEYRENMLSKPLYPESGRYRDFIELMSRRYLVLGKAEGMKMDQILEPEYLRRVLRKETDILKFEYCIREKNVYALLNIIPVMFDGDGLLTQVMMIGQDVGQKVELENLANTDGLTGLYNERYFSRVLANTGKEEDAVRAVLPRSGFLQAHQRHVWARHGRQAAQGRCPAPANLHPQPRLRVPHRRGRVRRRLPRRPDRRAAPGKAGTYRRNADPTLRDRRQAPANRRELRLCPLSRRQRGGGGYPHPGRPAHVCRKGTKPPKKWGGGR